MKVSKFRLAVLVLLAVTVVYAVSLALSVQAYNEYKRRRIEENPLIEIWGDFVYFWDSSFGKPYVIPTALLSFLWFICGLMLIGKALKSVVLSMAHMDYQMEFKKRKKENKKGR